jgi:hypothetical protein
MQNRHNMFCFPPWPSSLGSMSATYYLIFTTLHLCLIIPMLNCWIGLRYLCSKIDCKGLGKCYTLEESMRSILRSRFCKQWIWCNPRCVSWHRSRIIWWNV